MVSNKDRSSRPQMFHKIGVLKQFHKIQRCRSAVSIVNPGYILHLFLLFLLFYFEQANVAEMESYSKLVGQMLFFQIMTLRALLHVDFWAVSSKTIIQNFSC